MSLAKISRIALRDAAGTMKTMTYAVLFLSPLLTVLFIGFLVAAMTFMLSLVQIASPDTSPLGNDRIAVHVPSDKGLELRPLADELADYLRHAPEGVSRVRLTRQFVQFLDSVRRQDGVEPPRRAEVPSPSAPPEPKEYQDANGLESGDDDTVLGRHVARIGENAASENTGLVSDAGLEVVVETSRAWVEVADDVPNRFDAAIRLMGLEPGRARYEIAFDPALLFSRNMFRSLDERIEAFNRDASIGLEGRSGPEVRIIDLASGRPDVWLLDLVVVMTCLSLALLYHSVGMQAVAGILAGERESRTLDVLLSAAVTWRQVIYGKAVGLLMATLVPTLFWSSLVWWSARYLYGTGVPFILLAALLVSLMAALTSVGCGVSATSPNTMVAKNRLGMVNMGIFLLVGASITVPLVWWPLHDVPLRWVVTLVTGDTASVLPLVALVFALSGAAVGVLELAHRLSRKW